MTTSAHRPYPGLINELFALGSLSIDEACDVQGGAVRTDSIDLEQMSAALTVWGSDRLDGTGPVEVQRLAEGYSNLTFIRSRSGSAHEWVLRNPPLGPLLPSAHEVLREARMITALGGQGVRLLDVVGYDEGDVLGAPS